MKKKNKTSKDYMIMCGKVLQEIMVTPKSEPARFNLLKKKAEKYLKKAKELEGSDQSTDKQGQ